MNVIIMYNYATVIDILQSGCPISFFKFWFEIDTLIQVRYCHLLGIWCAFIVHILFSSFFDSAHDKIDVYLKISFIYTSDLII